MSGLNEIIQWTEDNMDLDPNQSSEENFNDINKDFEKWGRSDLSDILGDEKPKFLEWIEESTRQLPEDIELRELEEEAESLEEQIRDLMKPLFNILGTPIR